MNDKLFIEQFIKRINHKVKDCSDLLQSRLTLTDQSEYNEMGKIKGFLENYSQFNVDLMIQSEIVLKEMFDIYKPNKVNKNLQSEIISYVEKKIKNIQPRAVRFFKEKEIQYLSQFPTSAKLSIQTAFQANINKAISNLNTFDHIFENYNARKKNFFSRNKDKLLILIIGAILGAVLSNISEIWKWILLLI